MKRITLATTRLYTELSEDAIIPAYSPLLFSGREKQIKLKFKLVNNLKATQDPGYNDTFLLATQIPLSLSEGNQEEWEIGFTLGFFLAEGSFVYRRHKNTKYSLVNLNRYARKNGMTLQEYLVYKTNIKRVSLAIGQSDLERGYVNIVRKHFNFKNPCKIKYANAFDLFSFDLDLIHLIKFYIEGHDSYTKHLKNEAYNRSQKFLEGILDGFLAGDAHYDKNKDYFAVEITTNYRLYNDLIFLSKTLGYDTHINKGRFKKNSFHPSNNYYYLILSISKNWHRRTAVGLVKEHIKKIEDVGEKDAFNLVVKPLYPNNDKRAKFNHLYFTAFGILVSDAVKTFVKPFLPNPKKFY